MKRISNAVIALLITFSAGFSVRGSDTCPGTVLDCNTCVTGSTVGLLDDHDCGEGHEGPDAVYQFTLSSAGIVTIIGEADFDADWTIATTCDDLSGDIGCFDWLDPHADPICSSLDHVDYGYLNFTGFLDAGTYYLWIDGFYSDETGNYAVELICDTSPTPVPTATPTPSVPGDHCDNIIDISAEVNSEMYPFGIPGDSSFATDYYQLDSCSLSGADGPELVYAFTPDTDRSLSFDLCAEGGTLEDSVLYVRFDGPCPGNTEIVCDDDGCSQPETDLMSATACRTYTAGTTYYLFVDSYAYSMPGTFTLTIDSCFLPQCDPDSLLGQAPHSTEDFWTAYASDSSMPENTIVYDNFDIGSAASVCGVTWWGFLLENSAGDWISCSRDVDFYLDFYQDDNGQPGTILDSLTVTPTMQNTGLTYAGYPLYSYSATLSPCTELTGGWISIQATESATSPDCWFFWISSPVGDALSFQWDGTDLLQNPSDVSFCLEGYPIVPTATPTSTPTVTPIPTATPTFTPVPTATPTNTPVPTLTPTYTPTATPTNTPSCLNHGDVNFDGSLTAGDAQMAFYIVLGLILPTTEQSCAADCNGNGDVTAGDAQAIFLAVIGMGSCVDPVE